MATKKSEAVVRDIKRRTRRKYSAEEKITIVLEALRLLDGGSWQVCNK